MYLNVFDDNFKRLSAVANFSEVEFTFKYYTHSLAVFYIDATQKNIKLFVNQEEDRIITKSTDLKRGYIVEYADFTDDSKTQIMLQAKSLSVICSWRLIEGQQRFSGTIEQVFRGFVNANAINPARPNRIIPNLILGPLNIINIVADEVYNNKQLDDALWEMCLKYEISFEILMNHELKKYEFVVFQGADRSTVQSINPHVIFSKAFRNIDTQSYVDDKSNYKSVAYVAGEGEGSNRTVLRLNDNLSGFKRREIFFDARDLQSTYKDTNDNDITLSPAQYQALLQERGLNRLADYMRVQTFKSDSGGNARFKYGQHYFLGDKTTSRNDTLNLVMHSRVVVVKETHNRQGITFKLEFGSAVPTIFDKLKRVIKDGSA